MTQRALRRPVDPAGTRTGAQGKLLNVPSPTGLRADGREHPPAAAAPETPKPPLPVAAGPYADDAELVSALRRGDARAQSILVERYEPLVERLVAGALGIDAEIPDVVQDVFVAVLEGVHNLKDASALRSWIATLTVFTARGRIRRRRRWRWIRFVAPEEVPEVPVPAPQGESNEAVRATYAILATFPDDERLAFSLRFVSEMQLTEVAEACRVSLATVKRRLARAEKRFVEAARSHPALNERMIHGGRWGES
jgi:RNA polymerase sigma-70 factor, ECF subfamily